MNLILFDDPVIRINLLPFTYTRPVAGIRVGILTLTEKWERWLKTTPTFQTAAYLEGKFPKAPSAEGALLVNGAVCPDEALVRSIEDLHEGYFLVKDQLLIAARAPQGEMNDRN